jgi:hypothetical protein
MIAAMLTSLLALPSHADISMVLQDKFTTEGLILIALAIVPTVLLALGELRRRRPLAMAFDEQPDLPQGQHRLRSSATIGLGPTKLHVVLRPRVPINVKSLDIRFVGRGFLQWHDAWSPQIRVTGVEIPQWGTQAEHDLAGPNSIITEERQPGAFIVSVHPPMLWTAGDPLYVELEVEAEDPWAGHLSIRCCGERRSYTRRPVTAVQKQRRTTPPWRRSLM